MRIRFFFYFIILFVKSSYSQNLVYNPSFEEYTICPYEGRNLGYPNPGWISPNFATTDFFNKCSKSAYLTVPNNQFGVIPPKSGDGYAGIVLLGDIGSMEHLQGELIFPLEADKNYLIKFYVYYPYEASMFALNKIGVNLAMNRILFGSQIWGIYDFDMQKEYNSCIEGQSDTIFNIKGEWMEISGIYKAKGGEKYITIGMMYEDDPKLIKELQKNKTRSNGGRIMYFKKKLLKPNPHTPRDELRMKESIAYYFIDDVSVKPVDEKRNEINWRKDFLDQKDFKVGETYLLDEVYFEPHNITMIPYSYQALDTLANFIIRNQQLRIEISDHTFFGSQDKVDLKLSERRSQTIYEYLISKGIDPKQITYEGYAGTKPIVEESEENNKINSRVEIKILEVLKSDNPKK